MDDGRSTLKEKALEALKWTFVAKFSGQLISWVSTFFVIRMLAPDDYGLLAMATISGKLLIVLARSGIGDGLIQARNLEKDWISNVLGFLIFVNIILCIIQIAGAPWIASYFDEPRVELLVQVLAIVFLLVPWITMPSSLLSRDIEFKKKSIVEFMSTLFTVAITLFFAYMGFGVWALISGIIMQMVVQAIGFSFIRPVPWPPRFEFKKISHLIVFGSTVTASLLIWTLYNSVDLIIGGYVMDAATLGLYATALQLVTMPMEKVMPVINQVAFPIYSKVQTDREKVNSYLRKTISIGSLISFPVFLGISAVAEEFVPLVLGNKWDGLEKPLIILGLCMPLRVMTNLLSPALKSIGKATVDLLISVCALIVLTACFLIGSKWGAVGLAGGWLVGMVVVGFASLHIASRTLGMNPFAVFSDVVPATIGSILMVVVVRIVAESLVGLINPWLVFMALIVTGAGAYMAFIWYFYNEKVDEVLGFLGKR